MRRIKMSNERFRCKSNNNAEQKAPTKEWKQFFFFSYVRHTHTRRGKTQKQLVPAFLFRSAHIYIATHSTCIKKAKRSSQYNACASESLAMCVARPRAPDIPHSNLNRNSPAGNFTEFYSLSFLVSFFFFLSSSRVAARCVRALYYVNAPRVHRVRFLHAFNMRISW